MNYCCAFKECGCKIIKLDGAPVVQLQGNVLDTFQLMQQHKDGTSAMGGSVDFLLVKDVWDFDNIGVSKDIPSNQVITQDNVKFEYNGEEWSIDQHLRYLICADCDKGPIGMVCSISNGNKQNTVYMLSVPSVSQI